MMQINEYNNRHQKQRQTTDADMVEMKAMKFKSAIVDAGIYDNQVAGAMDDHAVSDSMKKSIPLELENDIALDSSAGDIHEEIQRRIEIMGDIYPFMVKNNNLLYKKGESVFYEFLLICSTDKNNKDLPRLFERVTAKIVTVYFGDYAKSSHTGFPRDKINNKSVSFQEAMKQVNECTGEFKWSPEEGLDSANANDEGCDFVVWLKHADNRQIGQLFILGQCACGNDWKAKWSDLSIPKFQKWFNTMSIVPPVKAFATPHHVVDGLLKEASRQAGMFFDRARLTMILAHSGNDILGKPMQSKIHDLLEENF